MFPYYSYFLVVNNPVNKKKSKSPLFLLQTLQLLDSFQYRSYHLQHRYNYVLCLVIIHSSDVLSVIVAAVSVATLPVADFFFPNLPPYFSASSINTEPATMISATFAAIFNAFTKFPISLIFNCLLLRFYSLIYYSHI